MPPSPTAHIWLKSVGMQISQRSFEVPLALGVHLGVHVAVVVGVGLAVGVGDAVAVAVAVGVDDAVTVAVAVAVGVDDAVAVDVEVGVGVGVGTNHHCGSNSISITTWNSIGKITNTMAPPAVPAIVPLVPVYGGAKGTPLLLTVRGV